MRKTDTSLSSKLLNEFDRFLKIVSSETIQPSHETPGHDKSECQLSPSDKKNIQGLMRINHTGEVCAQALYYGQALFAKNPDTYEHLIEAAAEEYDHLCWCQERLNQLNTNASVFNAWWYTSSFMLGAIAALFGDKVSYGFVIEVEKQVEDHLQDHIDQIPIKDVKTHAILNQMKLDEIRHGENARQAGGVELPESVRKLMGLMSKFMKIVVYRV